MARVILHSDANAFYASVECLLNPSIRHLPVAVCGDPAERHGIVLAKNQSAKLCGVATAEPIWKAKLKCPNLVVVPPHYDRYLKFSQRLREIYGQYTERVEAYGLDENWLDVSGRNMSIQDGFEIAEQIRSTVLEKVGITVSVGVSFNKVFAKLGSDYKKPNATTVISEENYRELIWPLPAQELLFVGPSTAKKLAEIGIYTIGQLAMADAGALQGRFGKNGLRLKTYASGLDQSAVLPVDASEAVKSISNSTTPPHDIENMEDAKCIFYLLAESVAARLREERFRAGCVSISARTVMLNVKSCQRTMKVPTSLTTDLARTAIDLFCTRFAGLLPLRSVGLCATNLVSEDAPVQTDLFGDIDAREHALQLERTLDDLRRRFGHNVVQRGVVLADGAFARLNPRAEDGPQGVAFVMGNRAQELPG